MTQFPATFFEQNRRRLMQAVPNSLIVIPAHMRMQYSADMSYPFRQDSNFWYLSGLQEPDVWLVIDSSSGEASILSDDQSDYAKEWEGVTDTTKWSDVSGIRHFASKKSLDKILKKSLKNKMFICYFEPLPARLEPYGFITNPARKELADYLKGFTDSLRDVRLELARLRQVKQPIEIEILKKAIDITADSLEDAFKMRKSFRNEKELERFLTARFYELGADGHAYEPIVASGKNAATLHYQDNNQEIDQYSLVLLDVGARYENYAADISRTWSINRPNDRQSAVYAAVLELQERAFSMLKPGVNIRTYQKEMEHAANLARKKLGKDESPFPHGFSHFLGIDVHDSGDYDLPLEENMILTVEPGFYFADESIGIRLEDNVRITKTGIENLSKQIPKVLY